MTKFYFKLEYTVRDLIMPDKKMLNFAIGGAHNIHVIIQAQHLESQTEGHKPENASCTAFSEVEPNEKVEQVFHNIAANKTLKDDEKVMLAYTTPDGALIQVPQLSNFPINFLDFINGISDELRDVIHRTVSILRWRTNYLGPHNPYASRGLFWSVDNKYWHPAPAEWHIRLEIKSPIHLHKNIEMEVIESVNIGMDEPIFHGLFREAWEQRDKNPRSALVIGIAAAEISIKQCISFLVPDAEWLASNLPTPPIEKILKEYIPQLPAKNSIIGLVKAPPENILEIIRKGVNIRNELSHTGKVNPKIDTVEEILYAVQDILWLMDFYSGHEWAFDYLSPRTREELLKD